MGLQKRNGRPPRNKGQRVEREMVKLFDGLEGVTCRRQPLSGALTHFPHDLYIDIDGFGPLVAEVKARANGAGFTQLDKWLGQGDLLVLKRDHQEPCYYMPQRVLFGLITALQQAKEAEND